jgi:hypothetical protein
MEGTHSTERREPNTTSICRRDCLKGGDHGQCSTPEKHATQTGGLPPVRNRTHTPNSPGQHTSEHSVEGWLKLCCDTPPPRQVPGVPERHLLYTRRPQVSVPKHARGKQRRRRRRGYTGRSNSYAATKPSRGREQRDPLQGLIGREQTARKGENPTPTGVCRGEEEEEEEGVTRVAQAATLQRNPAEVGNKGTLCRA